MFNLEKIQNSDKKVKKLWITVMSAVSMIAVIIVWVTYLNMEAKNDLSRKEEMPVVSVKKIFKAGLISAASSVKRGFEFATSKILKERTIVIEN